MRGAKKTSNQLYTNRLINESSPYLLQHAHNPVNWYPYGEEAFFKAQKENKLILFSIGYASCHWCHVMEEECFENEEIAVIMNQHFVCVKVDREERPDIDQIYIDAVRLGTGSVGWPLNCFALPNGKPFWGGTYFKPDQWTSVLQDFARSYKGNMHQFISAAEDLTQGIMRTEISLNTDNSDLFSQEDIHSIMDRLLYRFDADNGGLMGQPKFPMPGLYETLLDYAIVYKKIDIVEQLEFMLQKWAYSGLYDILGGGFYRYSVDKHWLVPHFEKMLYDNAQILSLYAKMYRFSPKPVYKRIIDETIAWMQRDLLDESGLFYASYDSDSGGEEGKFYVWTSKEIRALLGNQAEEFIYYYGITDEGNFEGKNILTVKSMEEPNDNILRLRKQLFDYREKRQKPHLDYKMITSWNALTISGLSQAYLSTKNSCYLLLAKQIGKAIIQHQINSDGTISRIKSKSRTIEGFLDDYSLVIAAFIDLYEITLEYQWLQKAFFLYQKTDELFSDYDSRMFYYAQEQEDTIVRKMEVSDNVIPSSNALMSNNLIRLSKYTNDISQEDRAKQMNKNVQSAILSSPTFSYSWLRQQIGFNQKDRELIVVGEEASQLVVSLRSNSYHPFLIITGSNQSNEELTLFKGRWKDSETLFYYCVNRACQMPQKDITNVRDMIERN